MADIYYNDFSASEINSRNIVTFTEVPNILSIQTDNTGTKARVNLFFEGNLQTSVTGDGQYYISFLGETITNVMDSSKATNKRFWISGDEDCTAMSVGRALRNCSGIAADWNIVVHGPDIYMIAKTIGSKWGNFGNTFIHNIPSSNLSVMQTGGTSSSVYFNSKIDVDVYSGSSYGNDSYYNYVTTLEKNFYGDECAFDMSPVLATMSEYGEIKPYSFVINLIREDGEWQSEGSISGYTSIGYHCNDSAKFYDINGCQVLINDGYNGENVTLYTYEDYIPFSVLVPATSITYNYTATLKNSANETIWSQQTVGFNYNGKSLVDGNFQIPLDYNDQTYFVELAFDNQTSQTVRFNVIKPLKATEYCQRVFWRNEYGGISFFDFTGQRSESDSVDVETYEKNVFDYHKTQAFEKKKIYKNDYTKEVTLTSHLMDKKGKYIFNSLMKSKRVWTIVGGNRYYIIPKSIEVAEDGTYNDVYTAKLKYEYSYI